MFGWTKSVRAISAVLFVLGVNIGLFVGIVPVDLYMQASMLVIGAYFARRDTGADRGGD